RAPPSRGGGRRHGGEARAAPPRVPVSGAQPPSPRRSLGDLSRIAPGQRCHPRRGIRLLADAAERRHERAAPSDLATELVVAEPMRCLNRNPGAAQDRYRGGDWQTTRVSCTIARKVAAAAGPPTIHSTVLE